MSSVHIKRKGLISLVVLFGSPSFEAGVESLQVPVKSFLAWVSTVVVPAGSETIKSMELKDSWRSLQ